MFKTTIRKVTRIHLLAALVAACSPSAPQLTPIEIAATQIPPALSEDACAAPVPTIEAIPGFPARPAQLLGGGVVKSSDFIFDMWLYCDTSLSPSGEGAAYSEIAGLGIHLVWRYNGPEIQGATDYSFGLGQLAISGGGDSGPLTPGSIAYYSGGIHSQEGALGKAIQSGDLVTITTQVTSGSLQESASFSFAFQPGTSGLKLAVTNLEPGE
ncbi:MAG: hypothetical protein KKD28_04300 [Chloroflexi bacterium]|nr:hypothetical protein [Chloroflexota bacterium]